MVAEKSTFKHHLRFDELLIVVPDVTVQEPVPWDLRPLIVARIELEVDRWIEQYRPNSPHAREAIAMYRLRRLEHLHSKRSLDLSRIVET